jgi:hypothetical protein
MMLSGRPLLATAADRRYFVDRPEADIVVRNVAAGMNTLILGERGMGTTTLLRYVADRLEDDSFATVYLDGRRLGDPALILLAIRDALAEPRTAIGESLRASTLAFTAMPAEMRGEEALRVVRELSTGAEGRRACVLLDDPDPDSAHRLFGRLRDEMWQTGLIWVVAGDSAKRQQYLTPPADAFFERVVELIPLTDEQQDELVHKRLVGDDDRGIVGVRLESGNPRALLAALREATSPADVRALLELRADRQLAADRLGSLAAMMHAEIEDGATASASDDEWLMRFGVSRQRAQQVLAELEQQGLVQAERLPGPSGRPRKVYRRVGANS